jgi:Fe-S-cluster containining protein
MQPDTIFLTQNQALEAVCRDFRQYPPQRLLFHGLIRLITRDRIKFIKEGNRDGFWISRAGRRNMKWIDDQDLAAYMCEAMGQAEMDMEALCDVCSRVFRTRAESLTGPDGTPGIRIPSGMETFECIQCGRCCRSLDYHTGVTDKDVVRWKSQGRDDILEWVAGIREDGSSTGYRIWITPGTSQVADVCPFLILKEGSNRWQCAIHDVKPGICREYPATRKHGLMTGCKGFQN